MNFHSRLGLPTRKQASPYHSCQVNQERTSLSGRMLFAVPKKGRLSEKTFDLLQRADILFKREGRLDIALVLNLPIALIFLPAADIPAFVSEGQVDLGITGIDQVQEHEAAWGLNLDDNILRFKPSRNDIIMNLGYGDCRLQVQVPEKSGITDSVNLIGRTIGTSFVSLTKQYFTALEAEQDPRSLPTGELQTKVIELTGSVEAACALGVADGIVDLVESGDTMRAAGLGAIDTIIDSTAVLIKRHSQHSPMIDLITSRIKGAITAKRYVMCQYNIERRHLPAATDITPGKRAATVTALNAPGWVAVSSMVERENTAVLLDKLAPIGAQDILVFEIRNTRQ